MTVAPSLRLAVTLMIVWLVSFTIGQTPVATAQTEPGFQARIYAIENVTVVTSPGDVLSSATIVLRNGAIEAVGAKDEVKVPFDAQRIDGTGLFAYAGFTDGYSTAGIDSEVQRSKTGTGKLPDYGSFAIGATPSDNRNGLTPEFQVSEALKLEDSEASPRRGAGFTSALVAPAGGIATGQSALVSLSGRLRREVIIKSPIALHVSLESPGGRRGYPSTLMGYVAHLRQAMLDAGHYEQSHQYYDQHGGPRPPVDPTLAALRLVQTGKQRVFWRANSRDEIHRALDLAQEFGVKPVIVGGREAWRVADRLATEQVPVILRIDFPEEPKTSNTGSGNRRNFLANMSAKELEDMLKRPDLPGRFRERIEQRLAELKKPAASDQEGEAKSKKDARKLPESPRLLAEAKRRWAERIEGVGKLADKGVLFCFSVEGHRKPSDFHKHLRQAIQHGLAPDVALAGLTTNAAQVLGMTNRMGKVAKGHSAHLALFDGPFHEKTSKLRYAFIDADKFEFNKPSADKSADPDKKKEKDGDKKQESSQEEPAKQDKPEAKEPFPTEIEADRKPSFQTGGNVAIRNATVLTVSNGTLPKATVVVRDGKIAAVGRDIPIPEGIHVIEGEGLYVMPGIIDTHSHITITGGGNESSLAVVPEVRIMDVIGSESLSIYRAVAGGVTAARILHGSANPIGGQDAIVKLRWGKPGREMIIKDRQRGVKFALGENPKRSSTRYPDTRLGVEAVIRRSFEEGRMYRRMWQLYEDARRRGENVPPPRRDLRLEALADIVQGDLEIHSHCYRADEILMLMRLTESFGFRVKSLQHVLEGYKVAAEIAAHGASNATFSDWWAYKVEAYDAIPHNAALLMEAGAHVTLKSDDAELMRHLYQEAAKTMRYGGLNEDQALATITLNAAEQIGLGDRLGSIEVGKDADLVIFNGHPLNAFACCQMTLIDGEVYFERRGDQRPGGYELPVAGADQRQRTLEIPRSPTSRYALVNARIVPVSGKVIERGTLIINGALIESIQPADQPLPEGAVRVDLAGLSVYPGMINAGGTVGLTEIGSLSETQDDRERGQFNSDLRASIGVHPDSELIPVTRASGVLTTLTRPTGGVISGQSVLMNLHGWIAPEMTLVDPAALHINFPTGSYSSNSSASQARKRIEEIKQRFEKAVRYDQLRRQAEQDGELGPKSDPKLQALAPYALGRGLVIIHAERHGDILAAIEFAQQLNLHWVLSGGSQAWKCVDALKEADVAVILSPSMSLPSGNGAPYDIQYRNAAILHKAGVRFAMKGESDASRARNLPFQAAMSVSYGLPEDEGLKAVTLYPAQMLGVEDQLGSIEQGKLANLVISDGNPLQPATQIKALMIAGKPVAPTNRQTDLYTRYRQRLQEVKEGFAPLGVSEGTDSSTDTQQSRQEK